MWRLAKEQEDEAIQRMCMALYAEDPSPLNVTPEQAAKTLAILRTEPTRGRAVALDIANEIAGYALLISFWSNELGGEVLVIDELYVRPEFRNQGHARQLLRSLANGGDLAKGAVALELEVTPRNSRAARLYSETGFLPVKNQRMRRLVAER